MTPILLCSLAVDGVPRVTLELPVPEVLDTAKLAKLKEEAAAAAQGKIPAPLLDWDDGEPRSDSAITLGLLDQKVDVEPSDVTSPHLCVIADGPPDDDLGVLRLSIVSGAVAIKTTSLDTSLLNTLWPQQARQRFGEPERLLLGPSGLELEVVIMIDNTRQARRYRLVGGSSLSSESGSAKDFSLTWQQLPWRDAKTIPEFSLALDPADRLQELRKITAKWLSHGSGQTPVALIDRFDLTGEDASVFVAIRRTAGKTQILERTVPTWSFTIGGADWTPRSLTLSVAQAQQGLRYSDGEDPFDVPGTDSITHLRWEWLHSAKVVWPTLEALAQDPPLLSTGEILGAGANSPYLWQSARLVVGSGADQRSEPGAWIRYRLDPLVERPTAQALDADEAAGLTGAIQLKALRRSDGSVEPWQFNLGLLPDAQLPEGRGRIWLDIEQVDPGVSTVDIKIARARVHAASPPLLALRTALSDPASVPNRADRRRGLQPGARILFGNDRVTPASGLPAQHVLQLNLDSQKTLSASAWEGARDVAVAYVAGPLAGLDPVAPALGNLTPKALDAPGVTPTAPPPDRVRNYEAGRVAVHLLRGIDLRPSPENDDGNGSTVVDHRSSTVHVSAKEDLFLPRAEAVAALLPWARWQASEDSFDKHTLEVFHRNLVLEALDWAASAQDRRNPQPTDLSPAVDTRDNHPEERSLDFSREEALASLERAVRDRFASAARYLTVGERSSALVHWLEGVAFRSPGNAELKPRITLDDILGKFPATGRPALRFTWDGSTPADRLDAQTLALVPSPPQPTKPVDGSWLQAWLRWTGEVPEQPELTVDRDGSAGARRAASSDVPLIAHRGTITATTAGYLAGRLLVFFAVSESELGKLYVWEPLAGTSPVPVLDIAPALGTDRVIELALDADENNLVLAVAQAKTCTLLYFKSRNVTKEVAKPSETRQTTTLGTITAVRLTAERLFLGTDGPNGGLQIFNHNEDLNLPLISGVPQTGPVKALDVRVYENTGEDNTRALMVALATEKDASARVNLYRWTLPLDNDGPTHSPNQEGARKSPTLTLAGGGSIGAVALQPLNTAEASGAFVYASVQVPGGLGRVVAWPFALIGGGAEIKEVEKSSDPVLIPRKHAPFALFTDPVLNADPKAPSSTDIAGDGAPNADWIVVLGAADAAGHSGWTAWPVSSWSVSTALPETRPRFGLRVQNGEAIGACSTAAVVAGRKAIESGREKSERRNQRFTRFGALAVTGTKDGSVQLWDLETGGEIARHDVLRSEAWLDVLGVVRDGPRRPPDSPTGLWVEPVSVADPQNNDPSLRRLVLRLSTLGGAINLESSNLVAPNTSLRLVCLDLPLVRDADKTWRPMRLSQEEQLANRTRQGVYGCDNGKGGVPSLCGVPIEVVELLELTFLEEKDSNLSDWPPPQQVNLRKLALRAILANPADALPDETSVPSPVSPETASITLILERENADDAFRISLTENSRFDWRFPLSQQLPVGEGPTLAGRLARLAGKVAIDNRRLRLIPDPKISSAEALGRLRTIINLPELVFDPGIDGLDGNVRFREALESPAIPEALGDTMPAPNDGAVLAAVPTIGPSGEPAVLLASQPTNEDTSGAALLTPLGSGRELVRYTAGFRRLRLTTDLLTDTADATDRRERLVGVGIAEDGTIRVNWLWEIKFDENLALLPTYEYKLIDREWNRYTLPSPAEDVQLFDVRKDTKLRRRWLLARCRDGSAWLWDAKFPSQRYELTPPDSAATVVVFGPSLPSLNNPDRRHWQDFFGQFDRDLLNGEVFDTVVAIGAADGSIRVYAIRSDKAPILIRIRSLRGESITSLSLAIDKDSIEAGTLPRTPDGAPDGLVLLACDQAGPPFLVEILSNRLILPTKEDDVSNPAGLPNPWQPENRAEFGVLFSDGRSLRSVIRIKTPNGSALLALAKRQEEKVNEFFVTNELAGVAPSEVNHLELINRWKSQRVLLTVSLRSGRGANAVGWCLYALEGEEVKLYKSDNRQIVDAAAAPLFNDDDEPKLRVLVATRPNGALRTWVQEDTSLLRKWDEKTLDGGAPPSLDAPARVTAATIGRAVVPLVACRGRAGGTGFTWSADLGAAGPTWPEPIGSVDNDVPIALVGLQGSPHLVVARPSEVSVWDLDRGRLVTRTGLIERPVALHAGAEFDRLWLLIASDSKWSLMDTKSGSLQPLPSNGSSTFSDARFAVLAEGIRIVHAMADIAGTPPASTLTIKVYKPSDTSFPVRVPVTVSLPEEVKKDSVGLLDVAVQGTATWVLLALNDKLYVVHLDDTPALLRLSDPNQEPATAVFDLDPEAEKKLPIVWTIGKDWKRVASWSFSDLNSPPTVLDFFDIEGKPPGLEIVKPEMATATVLRVDGHKRLIGVTPELVTVWDLEAKELVRSDALERGGPLALTSVSAVLTADKEQGRIRIWDQATGRLRQRLDLKEAAGGVPSAPSLLAALSPPARPRLVVGGAEGSAGLAVFDLHAFQVAVSTTPVAALTGLAADLDNTDRPFVAGVFQEDGTGRVARIWTAAFNEEADLFKKEPITLSHPDPAEGTPSDVRAVALHRLGDRLLAATVNATTLMVRDISSESLNATPALGVGATDDPFALPCGPSGAPEWTAMALLLADPLEPVMPSGVLVAVGLQAEASGGKSRFALLDLPLRPINLPSPDRPGTTWTIEADEPARVPGAFGGPEGPRLVAGRQAFRCGPLLRIDGSNPPLYDLPIQILNSTDSFLQGRITPTRRLDIQILTGSLQALGWPTTGPTELTARAALVQGDYSCFLIDSIDRTDLQITGALVVWDVLKGKDAGVAGLLLLDDIHLNAVAKVLLPNAAVPIDVTGPRVRLRAMEIGPTSQVLSRLPRREVLSWTLARKVAKLGCEWHLAEAVLDDDNSQPLIARGHLVSDGAASIQGDFVIRTERTSDGLDESESYTLQVQPVVYAAKVVEDPDKTDSGTTRDDVVYPTGRDGPVRRAFDLVEARPPADSPSRSPEIGRIHLVSPVVKGGQALLIRFNPQGLPFDPGASISETEPLPQVLPEVPLLVHREAQGGRLRRRWPEQAEPVNVPKEVGTQLDSKAGNTWLLAPLARTPRGVASLTSTFLVCPGGRTLEPTLLQTEVLLSVHQRGGALFSALLERRSEASPSVVSLLSGTVRRSSSAVDITPFAILDDKTVKEKVLKTGTTGVLVVRTIDTWGRARYRFVNSPYYSLIPQQISNPPDPDINLTQAQPDVADSRLLAPAHVNKLTVTGGLRYRPVDPSSDRPEGRAFQLVQGQDSSSQATTVVRLAEVAAVRASEYPDTPLPAEGFPMVDGVKTFLPHDLELGFGLGKPGALFHEVLQCQTVDPMNREVSLPTGLARREPQRFLPPDQAAVRIARAELARMSKTTRLADQGLIELTVVWEETLGAIDVLKADYSDPLVVENDPNNPSGLLLKEPEKSVLWVDRLGEQLNALPRAKKRANVRLPLTPFRAGRPVDAFELFLFTRAELTTPLPAPDGTLLYPMLVIVPDSPNDKTLEPRPLAELMEEVLNGSDESGWHVWRLRRQMQDGQPVLLSWINAQFNPQESIQNQIQNQNLNLIWQPIQAALSGDGYKNAPKLFEIKLRDVPHEPQSPRLAAVLRLPLSTGPGLLATRREITLFEGPSATTKGVQPQVEPEVDRAWIRFTAKDSEVLNTQDPFPADPPPGTSLTCGLFVNKIYEDGATLLAEAAPEPS